MDARLQKYAKLAIRKGVNLQKGQTLIINTSVEALDMTRACVEEAYQAGAKEVIVFYKDDYISKHHYQYQDEETLCTVRPWQIDSKLDYMKEEMCIRDRCIRNWICLRPAFLILLTRTIG